MQPGDRLPTEAQLAESFGVSRTVIREAVSSLKHEGLIDTRQGAGAFVSEITRRTLSIETSHLERQENLAYVFETRLTIEPTVATLAAERREDQHLDAMKLAVDHLSKASDSGPEAELHFHRAMAHATGNPYYIGVCQALQPTILAAIRLSRADVAQHSEELTAVWREHEAIFAAIRDGAPVLAKKAVRSHLRKSATRLSVGIAHSRTPPKAAAVTG